MRRGRKHIDAAERAIAYLSASSASSAVKLFGSLVDASGACAAPAMIFSGLGDHLLAFVGHAAQLVGQLRPMQGSQTELLHLLREKAHWVIVRHTSG